MTQETENPTRRSRHQKAGRLESNLGDATEGWVVGGGLWVVLNLNLNHNLNPYRYRRSASGDGGSKSLSGSLSLSTELGGELPPFWLSGAYRFFVREKSINHHEEREEHEGKDGGLPELANQFDALSSQLIGCAIEVHRFLGLGLMFNFNVTKLKDGIKRYVL